MQFGGDDQWSNMLGGTELIRKKTGDDAYAMTITLLLNSEGKKMGKTAKGAVWLDPEKTSPFEFYQYWRNIGDSDVMKCLRMLTFLPLETIDEMEHWDDSRINEKKEILAHELTALVHGKEEADKALEASHALFSAGVSSENMPTVSLSEGDFADGKIAVTEALIKAGIAKSKGEGKRLIEQGGITVNDEKITDVFTSIERTAFDSEVILKKGKKIFKKLIIE